MRKSFARALILLAFGLATIPAFAGTVTITSDHDTTILQAHTSNSLGGGVGMFSGADGNGGVSRALLEFDIAGNVPAGSTIQSVQLVLNLGQVAGAGGTGSGPGGDPTPRALGLHSLAANWGEGTVNGGNSTTISGTGMGFAAGNGDATWNDTSFSSTTPVLWTAPGGDFAGSISGSATVGNPASVPAPITWTSTAGMVGDVQSWLNDPVHNFGWILINGSEIGTKTFRAFYTKEATNASLRPALQITYTPIPEPSTLSMFILGGLGFWLVPCRRKRGRS